MQLKSFECDAPKRRDLALEERNDKWVEPMRKNSEAPFSSGATDSSGSDGLFHGSVSRFGLQADAFGRPVCLRSCAAEQST